MTLCSFVEWFFKAAARFPGIKVVAATIALYLE
jgi:hypothetical protein